MPAELAAGPYDARTDGGAVAGSHPGRRSGGRAGRKRELGPSGAHGVAERAGAKAVIAPIDDSAWLPESVARLLRARLAELGVAAAFPKPFCSLTEDRYGIGDQETACENAWIAEFARHFGRPAFHILCDGEDVVGAEVERDSACGCARALAEQLDGTAVCDLVSRVEEFHRQYPCLATQRVEPGLRASLLEVSCALMQQAVAIGAGVDVQVEL